MLVRDVETAFGKLAVKEGDTVHGVTQIEGALSEIFDAQPGTRDAYLAAADSVAQLQSIINERVGGADAVDFKPLREIAYLLARVAKNLGAAPGEESGDAAAQVEGMQSSNSGVQRPAARGQVASRQDALDTLDRVIRYLEQSEPGNPAPLLIKRAKRLIGVSFLDIMADLAPDAMGSIENITGRPS
jgi:type VI secretion system protein ImpA